MTRCSDDFVFDNEVLVQAVHHGFRIGEISCPARYFPEASSINLTRSIQYGLGVVRTSVAFRLHRAGLMKSAILTEEATGYLQAIPNAQPFA